MKKGEKFFTVKLDETSQYTVIPCTFQEEKDGRRYYKWKPPGSDPIVTDIHMTYIFKDRSSAVIDAMQRCHDKVARAQIRMLELAKSLR